MAKSRRMAPHPPAPSRATSSSRVVVFSLILVALAVAIYAQTAHHDFVDLDDGLYVRDNPHIAGGLTSNGVQWAATTGRAGNWHPVTWLSHMADIEFFGRAPGPMHLVSLAWHVVNTLLLFGVLAQLTGAIDRSAWVAAIFAIHPAHVESVAWIAERKDVLSTACWLLTMAAYVAFVRRPRAATYVAMVTVFGLGLMAKPMLVTLPFVLLLLDHWPLARVATWRQRIIEKLPLALLAIASSVITVIVQQRGGAVGSLAVIPLQDRVANALVSAASYLWHFVWPSGLVVFYPYPRSIEIGLATIAAVVLVAVTVWTVTRAARAPYLLVGWLWFLGTLVPVIGLVQVGTQAMADRYTYVPYIGLAIAVAWGVSEWARRASLNATLLRAAGVFTVLALTPVAYLQASQWRDATTLWQHAVAVQPDNARAHNSLGAQLGNQGRRREAAFHFAEAMRLSPDSADAFNVLHNLGRVLAEDGRHGEAIPYFLQAIAAKPDFMLAHRHLGDSALATARLDEAVTHYEHAIRLDPAHALTHHQLALALTGQKRTDAAVAAWRQAIARDPNLEDAHFGLGMALASVGNLDEARRAFSEVVRINPAHTSAQQALIALRVKR